MSTNEFVCNCGGSRFKTFTVASQKGEVIDLSCENCSSPDVKQILGYQKVLSQLLLTLVTASPVMLSESQRRRVKYAEKRPVI